jgi:hypothetical protein
MSTGLLRVRRHSTWTIRASSSSRPTSGSRAPRAAASVRSRENSERRGVSFVFPMFAFSFRSWTMSSRTAERRMPFSARIAAATHFSSRMRPRRMCSVPM